MVTIRKWVVYDIVLPTLRVYRKFLFLSQETLNSTCSWLGVTPPKDWHGCEVVVIMTAGCGLIRTRTKELYLLTNRRCTLTFAGPKRCGWCGRLCFEITSFMHWFHGAVHLLHHVTIVITILICTDTHTHLHLHTQIYTGWWFGTFVFLHILGMSSSQLTNIFQRGWNHQPDMYIYIYTYQLLYVWGNNPFTSIPAASRHRRRAHVLPAGGSQRSPMASGAMGAVARSRTWGFFDGLTHQNYAPKNVVNHW